MQDDDFEWNDTKATCNKVDHGITFELARAAFDDPNGIIEPDDDPDEVRWHWIAMAANRVLLIGYTERVVDDDPMLDEPRTRTRIISARKADKYEQARYYRQGT